METKVKILIVLAAMLLLSACNTERIEPREAIDTAQLEVSDLLGVYLEYQNGAATGESIDIRLSSGDTTSFYRIKIISSRLTKKLKENIVYNNVSFRSDGHLKYT